MKIIIFTFLLTAPFTILSQSVEYIKGTVIDQSLLQPNSNRTQGSVKVSTTDSFEIPYEAIVDSSNGEFLLEGRYELGKNYILKITGPYYSTKEEKISVTEGGIISKEIYINKIPEYFLYLFIKDEDGQTVSEVQIQLSYDGYNSYDTSSYSNDSTGLAIIPLPPGVVQNNKPFKLIISKKGYQIQSINKPLSEYPNREGTIIIKRISFNKELNVSPRQIIKLPILRGREKWMGGTSIVMFTTGILLGERSKKIYKDYTSANNEEELLEDYSDLQSADAVFEKADKKRMLANTIIDVSVISSLATLISYALPSKRWHISAAIETVERNNIYTASFSIKF